MGAKPLISALVVAFAVGSLAGCSDDGQAFLVGTEGVNAGSVVDGDTFRLEDGRSIRLLQIDAPEYRECYSRAATSALVRLIPHGSIVVLVHDPFLDTQDKYGRLLRYVSAEGVRPRAQINIELVRQGAAVPYFFRGQRGTYADELLAAAKVARRERRGLWGACPGAKLDPNRGALTGRARPS